MDDKTYIFDEIYDSMTASLENLGKVIAQQTELKNVLENNEKHDVFEEFIVGLKNDIDEYTKQMTTIHERQVKLFELRKLCLEDDNAKNIVNKVIDTFNMFGDYHNV